MGGRMRAVRRVVRVSWGVTVRSMTKRVSGVAVRVTMPVSESVASVPVPMPSVAAVTAVTAVTAIAGMRTMSSVVRAHTDTTERHCAEASHTEYRTRNEGVHRLAEE